MVKHKTVMFENVLVIKNKFAECKMGTKKIVILYYFTSKPISNFPKLHKIFIQILNFSSIFIHLKYILQYLISVLFFQRIGMSQNN
jgi:hypothetical protein